MPKNRPEQTISHRSVWTLAGPIMLSNISVPLVGAVDTAVVGRLPDPSAIGAVALGALIFSILYWGFGFLRMGTTGFIARAFGARDRQSIQDTLLRVLLIALVLGVLVVAISSPIIRFALYLLEAGEQVERLTDDYASIRIWSAPATLSIYVFSGVFIGLHNTWHALLLQLVLNLCNIVLDVLLVTGLGMGVDGVALATLIAEYAAAFFGVYLLRDLIGNAYRQCDWKRLFERAAFIKLLQANGDIFIRTLSVTFCFAYFTAESARFGEVILAANAILMHLQNILAYALDGFAHAVEALCGSAFGASNRRRFRQAASLTSLWAVVFSIAFCLFYWLFGNDLLKLFTDIDSVLDSAEQYLPWLILLPLISVWSFQLDGVFIGTGYTREMRNAMIVSMVFYLLSLELLLPWLGNHGLFLGLSFFMVLRAVTLAFYYPRILNDLETGQG